MVFHISIKLHGVALYRMVLYGIVGYDGWGQGKYAPRKGSDLKKVAMHLACCEVYYKIGC